MKKLMLAVILLIPFCLAAQNKLETKKVNVFKNGTYFIQKEGNIRAPNGQMPLYTPASPLLGTFWLSTSKEMKIDRIVYTTDTLKVKRYASSLTELMKANAGKKVKVQYILSGDKIKEVSGTLVSLVGNSGILKLKVSEGRTLFFPVSKIIDIEILEKTNEKLDADSIARIARVYFEKPVNQGKMRMSYMQSGIQWIPRYNMKVIDDKECYLELKALVENYAEPIQNAELTLTVGNPQFTYGKMIDPLAQNYLANIYSRSPSAVPVQQYQSYNNYLWSNAEVSQTAATGSTSYTINNYGTFGTEGEKSNDLYMYNLGKVSLPKNCKTSLQLFAAKVPYEDVYEVSIGDVVNYSYNRYINIDPNKRFDVYHSFKLSNTTQMPWTTAPVFVQDEKLEPLAQDKVKYTAAGGDVMVQLSKAGDVIVKNSEEEISKVDNAKRIGKVYYNLVTIKGKVEVQNLQDKEIKLDITKDLIATIKEASHDGKIKKTGQYNSLNPYSKVRWEIPLKKGEKKTITYTYSVYVTR